MKPLDQALKFAAHTDPGMVRSNNEDAVFVNPALGLAILADGMGGGNAGEVASGMATTLLGSDLKQALAGDSPGAAARTTTGESRAFGMLRERIAAANDSIFRAAEHQPQYSGMGTTLVVALFYDNRVAVAHIGDSRLYRLRAGSLAQLTRDHSFLQLQIDAGMMTAEEARHSKHKNLVTRALGIEPEVEPEIHEHRIQPGDLYILCSDGLHDMVDEAAMVLTLRSPGVELVSRARQLVQMANDNGGRDNVSVILVDVVGDFGRPKGWWRRLLAWFR